MTDCRATSQVLFANHGRLLSRFTFDDLLEGVRLDRIEPGRHILVSITGSAGSPSRTALGPDFCSMPSANTPIARRP